MPLYRRFYKFLDGDYGDITVASGGTALNIDAGVVGASELATSVDMTGKTWSNGTWDSLTANTLLTVAGNLTFSGTGRRITGDFSNGTLTNRTYFQTSTTNSATVLSAMPNGTGTQSVLALHDSTDLTNYERFFIGANTTGHTINSDAAGTGTVRSISMRVGGTTYDTLYNTGRRFIGPTPTDDGVSTLRVGGTFNCTTWGTTTPIFTTTSRGLVPASVAATGTKYLCDDGTFSTPSSSGANSVNVTVDFGASFTDRASTVVTGQTWVTSTSKIIPSVLSTNVDESYLLNIVPVISDLVVGTGFTVTLFSNPEARGAYTVMCLGV